MIIELSEYNSAMKVRNIMSAAVTVLTLVRSLFSQLSCRIDTMMNRRYEEKINSYKFGYSFIAIFTHRNVR